MKSSGKEFFLFAVGEAGNLGTFLLSKKGSALLKEHFPKDYLNSLSKKYENAFLNNKKNEVTFDEKYFEKCIEVRNGGYLAALWDMCEAMEMGLDFNLKNFPISQYTIEVCNFFDLNPYRLLCKNVYLISSDTPIETFKYLVKNFNDVNFIGVFNNTKKRLRVDGDVDAFLTKDHKDELLKIYPKSALKEYLK